MPVQSTYFGSAGSLIISGTADRAAVFNADGELESSTITRQELETLDGSDTSTTIQAQLDAITTLQDGFIYIGDATNTISEVQVSGDIAIDNTGDAQIQPGVIVNADVNASAAIERSKLANGTADRVIINDGSGIMGESSITATELSYLNDFVPKTQAALADNQAAAATIFQYSAADFDYAVVEYGIERGAGNRQTGRLLIATDGSTAAISDDNVELGTVGVTLSVNVSGGNLQVQYTSTSTGTAPNMTYIIRKWGE